MDKKLVRILFVSSLLIILTLTLISYLRFSSFNDFNQKVRKKSKFSVQLKKVEREFMTMVAFQRSYLVGEQQYHENAYEEAKKVQLKELNKLVSLSKTMDTAVSDECQNLLSMIVSKIKLLDDDVDLVTSTLSNENQQLEDLISDHTGFTSSIVDQIDKIENIMVMDVDKEIDIQEGKGGYTPWSFLILVVLTIGLLYITYNTLTKELAQRKQVAEKQQFLLQKLKASNADLERYAYVASHDLQEPLRKIQVFTDRAAAHPSVAKDKIQQLNLSRIQKSAKRMTELIEDLLEYGRISGKQEEREAVNLSDLYKNRMEDFVEDMELSLKPDIEEEIKIIGVRSQLDQLVSNLLSNSIKFRDKNKKHLRLMLSSREVERNNIKYLQVSFSDNGVGFENQYSDQIFTVFNRLVGRNEVEGTGIGLSICKRVMTVHNGFIKADSKEDGSATFSCFFPLSSSEIDARSA